MLFAWTDTSREVEHLVARGQRGSERASIFGMMMFGSALVAADDDTATTTYTDAQTAKLFELEAAFHRDVSVHNYLEGDSPEVVGQRIRLVLSLLGRGRYVGSGK
jgi:hypothetical protein